MKTEIITTDLRLDIVGYEAKSTDNNYTDTAFTLSKKLWDIVKRNKISNKGTNIWIYDADNIVFAGVEAENPADCILNGLQQKTINIKRYARYLHIGSYEKIPDAGKIMMSEIFRQGYSVVLPYIEIYGHSSPDENKCVTELIMALT